MTSNSRTPLLEKETPVKKRGLSTAILQRISRLLDRSSKLCQSEGKWKVNQLTSNNTDKEIKALFSHDYFHSLLELPTYVLVLVLLVMYMLLTVMLGLPFLWIGLTYGDDCIDPASYTLLDALYFNFQTMSGIGYDANDIYFGGCASPLVAIYLSRFVGIVFEIVAMGVMLLRMTRADQRSASVIFSKYAVIRKVNGQHCFMFRCFEMRTNTALIEAHVRCYVIRHVLRNDKMRRTAIESSDPPSRSSPQCAEPSSVFQHGESEMPSSSSPGGSQGNRHGSNGGAPVLDGERFSDFFQPFTMRIQHPDDELGAMLLLSVPSTVVHRLDAWSPLVPTKILETCIVEAEVFGDMSTREDNESSFCYNFPQIIQRQSDSENGSRTCANSNLGIRLEELLDSLAETNDSPNALMEFLRETEAEVVVVIEGIEPLTSCTVQARCSYTVDEIRWGHEFLNCVGRNEDGTCDVYLDRFLETRVAESDF